jgi:hypothetical protein
MQNDTVLLEVYAGRTEHIAGPLVDNPCVIALQTNILVNRDSSSTDCSMIAICKFINVSDMENFVWLLIASVIKIVPTFRDIVLHVY